MSQALGLVSVVVRDYDEALDFYVGVLGFDLIEDTLVPEQGKRWVVVRPPGAEHGCGVLLARASNEEQAARVGDQTGGRVFLFLYTEDFGRDFAAYRDRGVVFVRPPSSGNALWNRRGLPGPVWQPVGSSRTETGNARGIVQGQP